MVEVVAERGYAGASVELVIARAGVSRRTFYRCYAGREACFAAIIDLGLERTIELISNAFERERAWQDGVRMALASLLVLFDSEPLLARVWLVESLGAGPWLLEHREHNLRLLRALVVSSWPIADGWSAPPLAAEGVIGSVLGLIHSHLVMNKPGQLLELLGPLMGLVAGPYLSPRGIAREVERGQALVREIQAGRVSVEGSVVGEAEAEEVVVVAEEGKGSSENGGSPAGALPAVLSHPQAHRARECLCFLAAHPGASNGEVAAGIGVTHPSQISRLLSGLLKEELVRRRSDGVGKRNAWWLTARGGEVALVSSDSFE
jgi:AcrR family transcriptional regulator